MLFDFLKKKTDARNRHIVRASGYSHHGASYSKKSLLGWMTSGRSADEDIADNLKTLRNRSRDLYMGSPLATGAIKTVRTNVIGSGLMLNPQPDMALLSLSEEQADTFRSSVMREWDMWAGKQDCDAARQCTFYQLQSLAMLSALMSGDVFATMPVIPRKGNTYDLRISLIEADRVCDPEPKPADKNIVEGVEIDNYGAPLAFWVAKNHPGAIPRTIKDTRQEWKRVLAYGSQTGRRNVLHIMADIERPGQRRGVPMLAPVIEALKQLGRYTDAELVAAVVSGMFTAFIESEAPDAMLGSAIPEDMQIDDDVNAYELGNGSIVGLAPGEKVNTANPGRPNTAFDGFVTAICRQIGAALELPYELLMKQFTASYSASRAALLEAWKMFRMRREWMIDTFCQPVYEEWLTEAVAKGRISAPGFFDDEAIRAAWFRADWYGDSQGQLDPLKEANAAKVRVEECFSTREREAAELSGMTYDTIISMRSSEERKRKTEGLASEAPVQTVGGGQDEILEPDEQ